MSIFIKNIMNNDLIKRDSSYWKVVNGQYFFIIKTFDKDTSLKIKNGVNNDQNKFVFDNYGNIVYDNIKYINPLVTNKPSEYDSGMTIERIKTLGGFIYKTGSNMLASYNLKFILYFGEDKAYVLYNPLHREYFKKYYDSVSSKTGLDGRTQQGEFPLDTLFRSYCASMKDSNNIFVDPTCLCIESPLTCKQDSIFKVNVANFPQITESTKRKIGSVGNCCTAYSPGCDFGASLEASDSFIPTFMQNVRNANSGCPSNFEFNDCSILLDIAGDANFKSSDFVQECGSKENNRGTTDTDLIIDAGKSGNNANGTIPGTPTQGIVQLDKETNIGRDLPPVSTQTMNPTLSDDSNVTLKPKDIYSNQTPTTPTPAGGSFDTTPVKNDMVPIPSSLVNDQIDLNKKSNDQPVKQTAEKETNSLIDFYNKNKILTIAIVTGISVLIVILIIFLFLFSK